MLLAAGSHWDVTRAKVRAKVRAQGTKATRQTSVFGLPHTDKCERSSAACDVRGSSFAFTRYVYKYTQVHTSPRTEEHEHHEDPYREHDGDERLTAAPASVQLVAAVPDTKADEEVEALADGDEHREGLGRDAEAVDVVGPHSLLQLEPHAGGRAAREGVGDLLAATQAHLLLDVGLDVQLRPGVHVGVGDGRRAWRRLASLALRRHDLWRREKERTANNSVHEARGRGGKGQDIGEKSTVSARQHVWVRTPSVRLAIFSDVKRRSDPDPDAILGRQFWICSESLCTTKDSGGPTCKGSTRRGGRKVGYEGHGVRVRMDVCRLVVLTAFALRVQSVCRLEPQTKPNFLIALVEPIASPFGPHFD